MNALTANTSLRKLILTTAAMLCLNSAQAHPGHAHDGGLAHAVLHGAAWLAGGIAVAAVGWGVRGLLMRRTVRSRIG